MATILTTDEATIFYKDWGRGQPIVFSHGWPLDADAWDEQLWFMASHGLRAIDVPALILHGDDDQIVPIEASARATARLVKSATLKVYPGAPHGLTATHQDRLHSDLLEFIRR
jgi:pimeloyl-ACP methyl ester carboxylesterase